MSIAFVSSMNSKLYESYGKRFLEEFANFSSGELVLYIIFEGEFPMDAENISNNIIFVPLNNERHVNFMNKFGKLNDAKGLRMNKFTENGQLKVNFYFDYRWDAIKFSFKPFSIHQSLSILPKDIDHLIWTDADLRCKKKFYPSDLMSFLPKEDEIMSYLGRKGIYSECGFLGFNLKNSSTIKFINRIIDIYENGEIFSLKEWHDSYLWDYVRIEFENNKKGIFKNISGDAYEKAHVYVNTGLNEFFDHLKGPNRKERGSSFKEDFNKLL